MSLLDFVVLILATSQVIEVYRHAEMPLVANFRAKRQASGFDFVSDLWSCPFCLSVWIAAGAATLWAISLQWPAVMLVAYALAIGRGANLLNDLTHKRCRTPNREQDDGYESDDSAI